MAEESSIWDRMFEGVDLGKYDPREWSGKDIWNVLVPGYTISEANAGEDEAVAEMNARWAALDPAEKKRIVAERLSGPGIGESAPKISRAGVSQASPMPTREQVMGRVLAPERREYPPQTRTPSRASSRAVNPRARVVPQSTRKLVDTGPGIRSPRAPSPSANRERQLEIQRQRDIAEFPHLQKSLTRKAPIKPRLQTPVVPPRKRVVPKSTKKLVDKPGTTITSPRAARRASSSDMKGGPPQRTATRTPVVPPRKRVVPKSTKKLVDTGPGITSPRVSASKVVKEKKPKVIKKVAKKKFEGEPRTIAQAKKMVKKYFINKAGKKLAAVTKKDLADFRKKTGNPKATLTQLLNARRKLVSPTEWKRKSVRKTGGIVKKAGGGRMNTDELRTAEMRSAGKDLHQPQSKIKKRIKKETRYASLGGKVGGQDYRDREDESISNRLGKGKATKKNPKKAAKERNLSYGKWGKGTGKGKINRKSSGASFVASLYD